MTPQFSIIIPTFNRADGRLQRALDSIVMQTHHDFECIIVDDASQDGTLEAVAAYLEPPVEQLDPPEHCAEYLRGGRFRYVRHKERSQRVISWNTGLALSAGDWFCRLDDDDAWDQMYLQTFAYNIEQEPGVRLWVAGAVVHGQVGEPNRRVAIAWTKIRPAWLPPVDTNGAHELFASGKIGTGMFIFARECYEKVGPMPPWKHPDHCADGIDEWLGLEFGTLGYGSGKRGPVARGLVGRGHIGNPWGDDHAFLLALTRHFRVHTINAALYVHYVR